MYIDFGSQSAENWRAVNDGVMGGLSSGGSQLSGDSLTFKGAINTNGGGFSSIRHPVKGVEFSDTSHIKLRIKPDGRQYRLTFRTDARYGWRQLSFQADIPQSAQGEWSEVTVDFADLKASIFGRPVKGAVFNKTKVEEIGIIIADGKDGPFQLEIDWMKSCK